MSSYLYQNTKADALERLQRLEAIEDEHTISVLKTIPALSGLSCLELGAGAGSIASWLVEQVGPSGRVLATDLEPVHLDQSKYEVLSHDLQQDSLPSEAFDLVHLRHLLIHLPDPVKALNKIYGSLKSGGCLIAEESDLRSWQPLSDHLAAVFSDGVQALTAVYTARGMDTSLGAKLADLMSEAGFQVTNQRPTQREVVGGSPEAIYQGISARQLAGAVSNELPDLSQKLLVFSECFSDPQLKYQSRTTISVVGNRARQGGENAS